MYYIVVIKNRVYGATDGKLLIYQHLYVKKNPIRPLWFHVSCQYLTFHNNSYMLSISAKIETFQI